MQKLIFGLSICLLLPLLTHAQHGTAEDGYWPMGFVGDTWTGVVSSTNDGTREITLRYTKGDKTQTFTGVLQDGYGVKASDGTSHVLKVSEIPRGTKLKVYYMPKEHKVEGRKVKYYEIIRLVNIKA
jgi:hypothetical protein